jgi:hypothetical protein
VVEALAHLYDSSLRPSSLAYGATNIFLRIASAILLSCSKDLPAVTLASFASNSRPGSLYAPGVRAYLTLWFLPPLSSYVLHPARPRTKRDSSNLEPPQYLFLKVVAALSSYSRWRSDFRHGWTRAASCSRPHPVVPEARLPNCPRPRRSWRSTGVETQVRGLYANNARARGTSHREALRVGGTR